MQKEILIIRLSSIGDVMHCTPVATSLKEAWPDSRITWLSGEVAAELLRYNPYTDEILIWPRERFDKHLRNWELGEAIALWRELRRKLSTRHFDVVLDIHGLFLTGMIAKVPKADKRVGLSGARELNPWFMTETAKPLGKHILDRYLGVLRPLGIKAADHRMILVVPDAARQAAQQLLTANNVLPQRRLAVMIPGTTWPSKNWPTDLFARAARELYKDFTIVLCGGKAEWLLGLEVQTKADVSMVNTIGKTSLLEMAAIIERAAVVIAGDTGPLYMASALDTPTVAIFGPTDPSVYAPPGEKHAVVYSKQDCAFCHKVICPRGDAMCIRNVTPQQVLQAVYRITGFKTVRPQWEKGRLSAERTQY